MDRHGIDLLYPRPLLKRDSFLSLAGEWIFAFDDEKIGEANNYQSGLFQDPLTIRVPYCYQSELSGIHSAAKHEVIWYQKEVVFQKKEIENKRILLHFDSCDYQSKVFVNGHFVGEHFGGYTRFGFDITDYVESEKANIVLESIDTYDTHQPRGKQKWQNEPWGCWYQEVNGIWKSVWLEFVDPIHVKRQKITPDAKTGCFDIETDVSETANAVLLTEVYLDGKLVGESEKPLTEKVIRQSVPLREIVCWDVDHPVLYEVRAKIKEGSKVVDEVSTPTGFRTIEAKNGKILINGKPAFLRLALEQGYFIKGIYTFEDDQELLNEIEWIKKLGFNGVRMHQKVEDERFYYLCDLYGIYVWCEMPSCYDFNEKTVENTNREWKEVVEQHVNHPSIIVWVPINESWGVPGIRKEKEQQDFINGLYRWTKAYDPSRLVVSNDGWEHCQTDLVTLHNYVQDPARFAYFTENALEIVKSNGRIDDMNEFIPFADGYHYEGQPILFDEFCGIGFNLQETEKGWGYGNSTTSKEQFFQRYKGLINDAFASPNLAGWCMTQLTDVYIEVNGLLTMDRKPKCDVLALKAVNEGRDRN